jgi:hypothetical protein
MYLLCRATGATRVAEFATSLGVSTLYLTAAVRDNGGGIVIGSEIVPAKAEQARANLNEAGLAEFAEIRIGDARQTFADLGGPIDFLLVDGWPTASSRRDRRQRQRRGRLHCLRPQPRQRLPQHAFAPQGQHGAIGPPVRRWHPEAEMPSVGFGHRNWPGELSGSPFHTTAMTSLGSSIAQPLSRSRRSRPSGRISTPVSFLFSPVANPIGPVLLTIM